MLRSPASLVNRFSYQLRWLGDYQTGQWDTDAAENVAYDRNTYRAFLASAEASAVQVVDVRDPVNPTHVSTLDMAAVFQNCNEVDCIYEDFDFGGGSAPCGCASAARARAHSPSDFLCERLAPSHAPRRVTDRSAPLSLRHPRPPLRPQTRRW